MIARYLAGRLKRKWDAIWIDVRYVELLGRPMWHVSVQPFADVDRHERGRTIVSQCRSPLQALWRALRVPVQEKISA